MTSKPHVNCYIPPPKCPLCGNQMVDAPRSAKFQCWPERGGCGVKIEFNEEMVAQLRRNPRHPKWGLPLRPC